jgi:hypothetical protein
MRIFDAEKDGEEEMEEGNVFMWVLKPLFSCLLSEEKRYVPKCRSTHCWTGYVLTQGKIIQ